MYQVSDAYKAASKQPVQEYDIKGTIGEVSFTADNILEGSFSISNQCTQSNNLAISSVYIGQLQCTFIGLDIDRDKYKGMVITPWFGLKLARGEYEYIPLGVFEIKKAKVNAKGVTVTAYDNMNKFSRSCTITNTSGQPYDMLLFACKACDVELGNSREEIEALANGTETLTLQSMGDIETWQNYIYWLAQCLGAFCTMDRSGRLICVSYGSDIADTLEASKRFEGAEFSTYETRYTGLSVINISDNTTSYYGMETDDGLTMNLGSNPFLQLTSSENAETQRKNVLNSLADIAYVPFTVTCLGNPAYDLGDVLMFTGGIGDEKKHCMMSYTFIYNKSFKMQGWGEDPALVTGNSKTDKNLSGLLSKINDEETLAYYTYTNTAAYHVAAGSKAKIIDIIYATTKSNWIEFHGEVRCTVTVAKSTDTTSESTTTYCSAKASYTNNSNDMKIYPEETWSDGRHILPLMQILSSSANSLNTFEVWLEAAGGDIDIPAGDITAYLSGTGMAGDKAFDGIIRISEEYTPITLNPVSVVSMNDRVEVTFPDSNDSTITEEFTAISLGNIVTFDTTGLTETVSFPIVVDNYTFETASADEYTYNTGYVLTDTAFTLKTEYAYESTDGTIDSGLMKSVTIDKSTYSNVTGIEVK